MQLCGFDVGLHRPFFLIAGTCSIEGLDMSLEVAGRLKEACEPLGIPLIYKGSFDKANRSSGNTRRGVGMDAGLKILDEVRRQLNLPILTDVHDESQVEPVAHVVDVLQTPAFLCSNLVADMTSLAEMRKSGAPVVFDVTHSVQKPGGQGTSSGGAREMVPVLARAGVAAGVAGLFMETHPRPEQAWSDGPNAVPLGKMKALLQTLVQIDALTKRNPLLEDDFQ
jgi:2-dehydro-3-deoxyphosphooctonate aldolase (KDO 8-P synthase)